MRTISSNALAKIATDYGTKPINILEVTWVDGTVIRYSDRDITGIQGKIISISSLDDIIDIQQKGSSSSISVVLDDCDESLRNLINTYDIHKRPCTLYQHFEGLALTDMFPIFKGYIVYPITWKEGDRTLSFDILSKIHSREVGFSPEQGQFTNIPPDLIGKVWPLCFGSPIHVPATRSNETLTGASVTLFGLPDATLDAKRRLLEVGIQSLRNTYDFYNLLINQASNMVGTAVNLQDEYVDYILAEDDNKQQREDIIEEVEALNKQVHELTAEFDGADDEEKGDEVDPEPDTIRFRLNQVRELRDSKLKDVKTLSESLNNLAYNKKTLERDFKYSKYTFNIIGKLREKIGKLLDEYYQLQQQLRSLDIIKQDQIVLMGPTVVVTNGYRFPQNVNTIIEIGTQYFSGFFNGNVFNFEAAIPTYVGIIIGPKRDTEHNTFYITDNTLKLQGKYCLLLDNTIIKVTAQDGYKCTFELRTKPEDQLRLKKRDISATGQNVASAKFALSHILTGNETDAEIINIMNQIPRDISKHIYDRLAGGTADTQVIKITGNPTGGTFDLYCDEFKSLPLSYGSTKENVKEEVVKFLSLMGLLEEKLEPPLTMANIVTVTGGPLPNTPIEIKFHELILPMPQIRADGNDLVGAPTKQKLMFFLGSPGDVFSLAAGSTLEDFTAPIPYDVTTDGLKTILEKLPAYKNGDLTITGGPLNEDAIYIQFDKPVISLTTQFDEGYSLDLLGYEPWGNPRASLQLSEPYEDSTGPHPQAACYVKSTGGAHEHTVGEIEKMLEDAIGKSQHKKTLQGIKQKLIALYNSKTHAVINGVADDEETFNEIVHYSKVQLEILKSVQIPQSVMQEAYSLISEHEYEVLVNFEILNYMAWRRALTPIQEEIPDEAEKYYVVGSDILGIKEVSGNILPQWVGQLTNTDDIETLVNNVQKLPTTQAFVAQVGSKVTLAGNYQEKYIANILPSTVHAVFAYRSINGVKQLFPVPSRYYLKNEADYYGILTATSISLLRPLSEYANEHWEEGIYVTLTSPIGPNTANIIKWIAQTFTSLSVDTASFDSVAAQIENYPSHFALFNLQDAVQLMQDIAWQARCAIFMKFDTLYIKYLAAEVAAIDTVTEDDIDFATLTLTCTPTEDLVTKLIATWKPSYNLDDYKIVLRSNISKYDVISEENNFYIYNIYELVIKSATFWMIRRGNTWKRVSFSVPLNKLNLETYDTININLANNLIATGATKALVESADYDSQSNTISLQCWLPILFGQMTKYVFAWPATSTEFDIFPSTDIVLSGNAGNPIGDKVPTGLPFDPASTSSLMIRPNDYGELKPSDEVDALPRNPADDLAEFDYTDITVQDFKVKPPIQLTDETKNQNNEPDEIPESIENPNEIDYAAKYVQYMDGRPFYGTIENFLGFTDGSTIDGADDTAPTAKQEYSVITPNGQTITVVQIQIAENSRIPKGTNAMVIYSVPQHEFQMQVPVWLGEENV